MSKSGLFWWVILVSALLFAGCEREQATDELGADPVRESTGYVISREEAFASLTDALQAIDGSRTRGGKPSRMAGLTAESLTLVREPRTRGSEAQPEGLYYVNFAGGDGFAMLSADRRVCDGPLAIAEQGHLAPSDFIEAYVGPTEAEIAEDAPGFTWYNAEEDDWYVCSMGEWDVAGHEEGRLERRVARRMLNEMKRCVDYDDGCDGGWGGGGYSAPSVSYGAWTWTKKVGPLVRTKWGQSKPYNAFCPRRGCGKKRDKAPAGCVAVALAQVLAANEYPANRAWWGVEVEWREVKRVASADYPDEGTEAQKNMVAALIREVGKQVCTIYTKKGSCAVPISVMRYMRELGYKDVWKQDLSCKIEKELYRMLDEGLPAVMAGSDKKADGHAWVVDGYIERERTISYSNGTSKTESEKLLHCNWGWRGTANGYYRYKMFAPGRELVEHDPIDNKSSSDDPRFKYCLSVISYRR